MTGLLVVDRNPLADAVEARLRAQVTGAHGFVGEPSKIPIKPGSDDRPEPYWVLHPWAGTPTGEDDLADTAVDLAWGFQLNVAGDSVYDVLGLLGKVDAALYRWTPVVEGLVCGRLKPPTGFDPGNPRRDDTEKPHRFWLPLQYRTTVTAT